MAGSYQVLSTFSARAASLWKGLALAGLLAVTLATSSLPMASPAASDPAVIPKPASLVRQSGEFKLTTGTAIVVAAGDAEAKRIANQLSDLIARTHGLRLPVVSGGIGGSGKPGGTRAGAIVLSRGGADVPMGEAYALDASPGRITITASTATGLLYGGTTLWQLLAPGKSKGTIVVPAVKIVDEPRFAWRGIMLDSARHFQSPEFIKSFIDWMAVHKLNVLHWHLTDDQSWRLEIRKYPKLTQVGAWRVPAGAAPQADIDPATGKPRLYGGFYTQDTAREIVRYAADRGITVVPEIEMPGHATAPIVAYPHLAATSTPPTVVSADWGIFPNAYSLDESTFTFLEDVLAEVIAVFPSKYIHIGGDEVEKEQWKHSAQGQAKMRELGTTDPVQLHTYFTQRIARYLEKHGRRVVGWDEILEPGLPSEAVVMSWRGVDGAIAAAAKGYDTIVSPAPVLYFDNRQSAAADDPPGRGNVVTLEDVYRFEPMPAKVPPAQQRHVLGLQANLWTEHIRTEDRAANMTFPRAAAIAEMGWTAPAQREWKDFVRRLAAQVPHYTALKLPFADNAFAVSAKSEYAGADAKVALSSQTGFGDIRYTVDGSEPTARSPKYDKPFIARAGSELRAATFNGDVRLSRTRAVALKPELALRRSSRELKLCSEDIALALEDDAPLRDKRAVFLVDVQNPCWIFPQVDMDKVSSVTAAVGQLPFNFQIGEAVKKVKFPKPETQSGELEVRMGSCTGEVIARLPLAPATASQAVTTLPAAPLARKTGKHDLCLRFAQQFANPEKDPIWVLDWIHLTQREPTRLAVQ